jgi:hypothetical protein
MDIARRSPSVGDLVRAISEEAAAPPPATSPSRPPPRANPLGRVLVLGGVLLIALLGATLATCLSHVHGILDDIRLHQERLAHPPPPPMPSTERLLDGAAFSAALAARPGQAARLHAARGEALLRAGRSEEAIAGFAAATLAKDGTLEVGDQVVLAEALLATGRHDEARALVMGLDFTVLDPDQRSTANAVLMRAVMAERQRERRRSRAAGP